MSDYHGSSSRFPATSLATVPAKVATVNFADAAARNP
jgi:hypothetical protein